MGDEHRAFTLSPPPPVGTVSAWPILVRERSRLHEYVYRTLLATVSNGEAVAVPQRRLRREVTGALLDRLSYIGNRRTLTTAPSRARLASAVGEFVAACVAATPTILPAHLAVLYGAPAKSQRLDAFAQYAHLAELARWAAEEPAIRASMPPPPTPLPNVYLARAPLDDNEINDTAVVVDDLLARRSPLRGRFHSTQLLYGCIWTRSWVAADDGNAIRTSAAAFLRHRRGRAPHLAAVTAEPLPSRIASLALGSGELDCTYHVALPELRAALESVGNDDERDQLDVLVLARRIRDVSDLALDLGQ